MFGTFRTFTHIPFVYSAFNFDGTVLIICPIAVAYNMGQTTRCLAIAERPRCRVCYSFVQKWKTETGRQYFTDIIGLSLTTVI